MRLPKCRLSISQFYGLHYINRNLRKGASGITQKGQKMNCLQIRQQLRLLMNSSNIVGAKHIF